MSLQRLKTWSVFTLVFVLSACTTVQTPKISLDQQQRYAKWIEYQTQLEQISSWKLKGKMGVKTGPKGGSATLKWNFAPDQQRIELYGPFGGGRVIIQVNQSGAVLRDTKGRKIRGKTASEVLYQRLGWQVPFDHLSQWARGLPSIGASQVTLDETGRLKTLIQDNWNVEYQGYKSVAGPIENLLLPTRINVSARPGTMEIYSDDGKYLGDELSVKIILKRWWEIQVDQL